MKNRILGKSKLPVSEIGFGGWGIGKSWWGETSDDDSRAALKAALDAGITFYDTAYVYGDGHSETLMGEVLRGKDVGIATKIPPKNWKWPADHKDPVDEVFPADWIEACTERSLKKLKRDIVELTQFHVWSDTWIQNDSWKEAVVRLKKSGKIKAFGVSINDHEPNSALKLVESGLVDSVQVIFNIFDQGPLEKLFPLCREKNVGVIVRVPLDEGGLSGTLTRETTFEPEDFRSKYFGGDNLIQTVKRVDKLKSFLNSETQSIPDLALKFILAQPEVSTVIPGMRKIQHVNRNASIPDQAPLSTETTKALRSHAWPRNFYLSVKGHE